MLKDDDVVFKEPLLFTINVDLKIGILSIQINQGYAVHVDNGIRHRAIYLGAVERRVRKKKQNSAARLRRCF